jgi:TonB-linked SusC/RagA family outer membrane protein
MRSNILLLLRTIFFICLLPFYGFSQTLQVAGQVTNKVTGESLPGATITVKGTVNSAITDVDGKFTIAVPKSGSVLVVSYTGMANIERTISDAGIQNFEMEAGDRKLDEVIIVGYGTQKKADLTAPVTTVNTEDMLKRTTSTPMEALQGSVPGIQIVSNGAPGSSPDVRIRGIGSFNNQNPLYVVDGMFVDDIGFLNANDIADMSILKDASGAAIYGVRAANGVVIITTKKGKLNMKTRVTYNGYVGFQKPTNVPKMATGKEFTDFALQWRTPSDSGSIQQSANLYGGTGLNPTTSTNWYDAILRKSALITNHGVDLQGGGEKITYSLGINYTYQNGILNAKNDFNRYNIRFQMEAKAFPWLKVGVTSILSNSTTFAPNSGAFLDAYTASPLFPVYDSVNNTNAFPVKFANSSFIGRGDNNPVATAYYNYNKAKQFQILPTIYAEANFWGNKLTFRSQLSQLYSSTLGIQYTSRHNTGPGTGNVTPSHLNSVQQRNMNYIQDNLLTYRDGIGRSHWTVLLGQSTRQQRWRQTSVGADNIPAQEEFWYVRQGDKNIDYYDENGSFSTGLSYFTRATYDFDNKYLLTATYRADGSSKYQTKWGYFPSVGLGWVISKENFMKSQKFFDFLKLRGSWGKLGNDAVTPNAAYSKLTPGTVSSAVFGSTANNNGAYISGYQVNNFFANVSWEVVTEWDGGIDFELLNRRLNGSVDYYNRKTNGAALTRPFAFGAPGIYGNWADMENSGFDINLNWSDNIGKLGYRIGGNLSTLKNKVTNIGSLANLMGGFPEWTAEFPNRIEVGYPIYYFYGYKVAGIYQNQHDVDSDPMAASRNAIVPGSVQPGYFKFKDENGNGVLDDGDRVNNGSYLPKITYGFNVALNYKKFDLSVAFQGVSGNKILNLNRGRYVKAQSSINMDAKLIQNLWSGEGSTNAYPSAYALTQAWNKPGNSFFVENGAYLRIQNIQLGYNLTVNKISPIALRIFATADRPAIFTKYTGFTPEISGVGYDSNVYPVSATYSLGVRATF